MKKIHFLSLVALLPLAVHASGADVAVSDTSRVVDLDEVIVVAQPKEQLLMRRQPLSSTSFGTAQMQQLGIQGISRLSDYVPSFEMPDYGSRLTSSMYIRGIGSRVNNTAVGIYYDNIPLMSKSAFNNHFYMLDRVDVLRGPQGTLYGANTEGGIVRVYSRNPMEYEGTDVNFGVATAFGRNVELAHYYRPSDRLAFMVAAFYSGQNGFFKNTYLDERNDQANEAGAKVHLTLTPGAVAPASPAGSPSPLQIDLTSDYQYTNQTAFPYGLYDEEADCTADPSTTITNAYRRQMVNTGLTVAADMGSLRLTSTTSHQYLWDRMTMDQDYVAADYMRLTQQQKMNALTQELTLRSRAAAPGASSSGSVNWQHTTGLFGSYEWLHTVAPVNFGDEMGAFIMSQWGMPAAAQSYMSFQNNQVPGDFHTPQLNLAAYHESNITFNDRLMLTLGLRYDYSQVKIDYSTQALFDLAVTMRGQTTTHTYLSDLTSNQKHSYNQLRPKAALTYTLDNSGSNVYAVVSKGFRAGGYNLQMFSDIFQTEERGLGRQLQSMMSADYTVEHTQEQIDRVNQTITYKPEESWNYELGTHLNLFDGMLKADAAVFFTQIRNQQLSVMAGNYGYGRAMVNAGRSYSCGAELGLRGSALDDHLTWTATYSFTNAKFREYDDSIAVGEGKDSHYEHVSYKDNHVPFIPQHQMSLTADYRIDTGCNVIKTVTIGANFQGKGKIYWEADNQQYQKLYATLGAHVSLGLGDIVLDFWGRNITDTRYNTFLVNSKITNQSFAQQGRPLQVGCDIRIHL
jgi:outer membrane receptor protein involved in Fe transport